MAENQRSPQNSAAEEEGEEHGELDLKYGALNLIQLMIPVTICMILVVANILALESFGQSSGTVLPYIPFDETGNVSGGAKFGQAVINTLIMVALFAVLTFLVVVLYYYKCYKFLYGYLFLSSTLLLGFMGFVYIHKVVRDANGWVDVITVCVLIYNTSVVGLISIYWKGPLIAQQVALLFSCVMIASIFLENLPVWTAWVLLGGMALYDLAAVLCPYGPLNMLVNLAQNRDGNVFLALVYNSTESTIMFSVTDGENATSVENSGVAGSGARRTLSEQTSAGTDSQARNTLSDRRNSAFSQNTQLTEDVSSMSTSRQQLHRISSAETREREESAEQGEEEGAKLGLGDFIFYSILVGRATLDSNGDWNIILGCVLSILIGLALTLLLLAVFKHALPALPISIALGLITYFSSLYAITPFTNALGVNQAFL